MLGAIPLLDGSSYSFDKFYRRSFQQIASAAGQHILFQRTGNPRFSDHLYKEMRTLELAKEDLRLRKRWEQEFSTSEAGEHQRILESLNWSKKLGVNAADLPCFVFVTRQGKKVATLRIPHHWYESESSWRIFMRHFSSWLGHKETMRVATATTGHGVISKRLSRLIDGITQAIDKELHTGAKGGEVAAAQCRPETYCRVITEKGERDLNLDDYRRAVDQQDKVDMFIDGTSRCASRRDLNGICHISQITARELDVLAPYIVKMRPLRPRDTKGGKLCPSIRSANHLFEGARRKVDTKIDRFEYRCFKLVRSTHGEEGRQYRFSPPDKLTYMVILPIQESH
jgi:hypothetical protein